MSSPELKSAVANLRDPAEIRVRCRELLEIGERGGLNHFDLRSEQLNAVAHKVAEVTKARYTDRKIPIHSRWRHFEVSGIDRWRALSPETEPLEKARMAIDLVIPSVLLDAGAGRDWRYEEMKTGLRYSRSEGLAIATFEMFAQGAFSSNPQQPLRTDAEALMRFDADRLSRHLQVSQANRLEGLEGRAGLLQSLGTALFKHIEYFGNPPRPGALIDYFIDRSITPDARHVLELLLDLLSDIWPQRIMLNGENLGDVWRHPAVRRNDDTDMLVPFHKLTQWLTYSLIEPFAEAGIDMRNCDCLTGLAEYRNGGLFVDLGVLSPRSPESLSERFIPESELVVEWRALTLSLLEKLAPLVRHELGYSESELPLGSILEGGTWAAGRQVAAELRPGGEPPISVKSNGTLF